MPVDYRLNAKGEWVPYYLWLYPCDHPIMVRPIEPIAAFLRERRRDSVNAGKELRAAQETAGRGGDREHARWCKDGVRRCLREEKAATLMLAEFEAEPPHSIMADKWPVELAGELDDLTSAVLLRWL